MEKSQPANWAVGTSYLPSSSVTLQEIKAAGLDSIELVIPRKEPDLTIKGLRKVFNPYIEKAHDLGLEVWSVHLPFGVAWDISTIDLETRNSILDQHYELLTWVNEWKIKQVVVHPSFEPIPIEERAERIEACKYSLHRLAEKGKSLDIHICVEDLPRTCLGNTSQEIKTLIGVNENLRVCCDVNHLLSETSVDFIKELNTKIQTVHMSDYDGIDERHWMPGEGIVKWPEVISSLSEFGYEGPFMFEVAEEPNPHHLAACWNNLLEVYENKK
ncbi:hypothetical protein J14TS2_38740 [Bacillus sp. J14TS2]|uniref:sugar phosphate isomerase/epimerase family protein n=1 Tax=Bacillus sp. J14TS2 TaxID=2807188 RepID=UPI001B0B4691|nr:sugar phosphate isomerase/epimerase family protein [Bacillus sp. J14TS2]GIN73399.1 hypothetical protein J14TS2_38740 [Bacillus sp. J14TS2]